MYVVVVGCHGERNTSLSLPFVLIDLVYNHPFTVCVVDKQAVTSKRFHSLILSLLGSVCDIPLLGSTAQGKAAIKEHEEFIK